MKEPFLPPVVSNEAKSAIPHKTLDSSVCHVQPPRAALPDVAVGIAPNDSVRYRRPFQQMNQFLFRQENQRRQPPDGLMAPVAG